MLIYFTLIALTLDISYLDIALRLRDVENLRLTSSNYDTTA
jgi:hypothetical protein